jgi:protein-disulfide isomerase
VSLARASVLAFFLSATSCGGSLHPSLREEIARSPRGTATVVFFTDFQCPFCRRTHAALEEAIADKRDRVRVVLKHVPLRGHPDARTAARAAVCAGEQNVDLAQPLFAASDLSASACEDLAVSRGVDRQRYRACVSAPATDARIDQDTELLFEGLDGDGVPVLFVGKTRLEGEQARNSLASAIDAALREER